MRKKLFYMILGGILFTTVTVIAETIINSNQVIYEKEDGTNTDVETALDELYTMVGNSSSNSGYTISFDSDGGGEFQDVDTITIAPNLPTPTKSGYTFLGWFTSSGERINSTTEITADTAVTARWYHAVANANGYFSGADVKANPVFYNPVSGAYCSESDYNSNADKLGNTGCLKWYAYSVDSNGVNMILDHNTHIGTEWNSSGSNTAGPSTEFLNNLSYSGWSDTLVRSDTYDGYNGKTKKFTIDYSGKKARLITAQEVADITNASNATTDSPAGIAWNEHTSRNWFYLDSKDQSTARSSSNKSAYSWLFDNLYSCSSYGCEYNDSTYSSGNYGYWTSSPMAGYNSYAWRVGNSGVLRDYDVDYPIYGLRPVITVSNS